MENKFDTDTALARYFRNFPASKRKEQWSKFASAHGVSISQARYITRKHPLTDRSLSITERITGYKVTRFDIYPEVFNREALKGLIGQMEAEQVDEQ